MRWRTERPPSSCFHFSLPLSGSLPSTAHWPLGRATRAGRAGRAGGAAPSGVCAVVPAAVPAGASAGVAGLLPADRSATGVASVVVCGGVIVLLMGGHGHTG